MGKLRFDLYSPTDESSTFPAVQPTTCISSRKASTSRAVALQVAFERRILKPVFHLIGYRLWV
jgi:hypothetical protein